MNGVKKATPIVVVDEVERCLPFWTEKLGFEVTATVPHEDRLGFAILQSGGVELMYQSRASVDADLGASGAPKSLAKELASSTTTLFVEVDRLDVVLAVLGDTPVVVPRRTTFYGMDEIFVRSPCGTLVGLAARTE
ncbi:MAG: VOC family protein [Gemmatimonadales bacterium]